MLKRIKGEHKFKKRKKKFFTSTLWRKTSESTHADFSQL